jgi:hypothetical protein
MSATAHDAAMAWLTVARSALARAAECEVAIELDARARYQAERERVEAMVRDATYELRIEELTRDSLRRERERPVAKRGVAA